MGFGGFDGVMGFGGFGGFGMIFGLLFWVAVIALVVWAAASLFPTRRDTGQDTALEILKTRYARGEIDQAEYEQAKKALS